MTPFIGETFHLSNSELGLLATVNLSSSPRLARLGPIADRIGPRKVIFAGVLVWSIATIGSALSTLVPDAALLPGAGRRRRGGLWPQRQHAAVRRRPPRKARPRAGDLQRRHGAGRHQRPDPGDAAGAAASAGAGCSGSPADRRSCSRWRRRSSPRPPGCERPKPLPARSYLLSPTYLIALGGGFLATFGASALIFWIRAAHHRGARLLGRAGQRLHAVRRARLRRGRRHRRRLWGDAFNTRARGGHAKAIGMSMLLAVPFGVPALLVSGAHPPSWC